MGRCSGERQRTGAALAMNARQTLVGAEERDERDQQKDGLAIPIWQSGSFSRRHACFNTSPLFEISIHATVQVSARSSSVQSFPTSARVSTSSTLRASRLLARYISVLMTTFLFPVVPEHPAILFGEMALSVPSPASPRCKQGDHPLFYSQLHMLCADVLVGLRISHPFICHLHQSHVPKIIDICSQDPQFESPTHALLLFRVFYAWTFAFFQFRGENYIPSAP